jgi:SOS-response transcriptional repressor LexA
MFMEQNIAPFGEHLNTLQGIHRTVRSRCNAVMDIKDIRTRQLAALIRDRYANNVSAFARAIDRSPSQINDTLAGRKSFGEKFARHIEDKLGLVDGSLDAQPMLREFRSGLAAVTKEMPNVGEKLEVRGRIPLISWVQAGAFCQVVDLFEPGDAEEWLPTLHAHGPHAYALRVDGDSMVNPNPLGKTYPPGCIVYVDPDMPITNGCRVIAKIPSEEKATFKVYMEDAGKRFLRPLNPIYPVIEMTEGMLICGVVVGKYEKE